MGEILNNNIKEKMAYLTEKYQFEKDNNTYKINVNGYEIKFINFRNPQYITLIGIFHDKHYDIMGLVVEYYNLLKEYQFEVSEDLPKIKNQMVINEKRNKIQKIMIEIFDRVHNVFDNIFKNKNWDKKDILDTYFNYSATKLLLIYLDILECIYIAILIELKDFWKEFSEKNPIEFTDLINDALKLLYDNFEKTDYFNADLKNIKPIGNA